uniref:RING-type E3 ubiquitin transferase n=1 Tax=Ditylenchus dipsaci TaxID=166011 RepID=A0A915DYJ5_9BILA
MEPGYFCYECNNRIQVVRVNNAPICADCRGGFVEEIENTPSGSNENQNAVFEEVAMQQRLNDITQRYLGQRMQEEFEARATAVRRSQVQPISVLIARQREVIVNRRLTLPPAVRHVPDTQNEEFRRVFNGNMLEQDVISLLINLLNNAETEEPAHIKPEDIMRLPMTEVSKEQVDDETQCVTCMNTLSLREKVAILDCSHIFHKNCIEPWLRQHDTCPICREVVNPRNW